MEVFRQEYLAIAQGQAREDAIISNPNMTTVDRIVFIVLERMYPLVTVHRHIIEPWKIASKAAVTKESVRGFFAAMHERQYMAYFVLRKSTVEKDGSVSYKTECYVEELGPCKHPERLDLVNAPKRDKHRKQCRERIRCKHCGSENIMGKVVLFCQDCGKEV
jgi:hypothetical protein